MKIKTLIVVGVAALAAVGAVAWKATSAQEVGVSKVSGNPSAYLGKVKIVGKTGGVDAARGLVQIVDDKGCCNLVLAVPLTAEQKSQLGADAVYAGSFPQPGQAIEAHGVIRQVEGGYRLDVAKVTSSGSVLVRRI
ncbi:MAG: hypothetical protein HZB55_00165 [Deltaproteobacteria bacterium]|nr:hypothetical protein [Deltaproteobacteria bacterium]